MPSAYDDALLLLAKRDYSTRELCSKLCIKGYSEDETLSALTRCQALGYQSDTRYIDAYCRSRMNRGDGPRKIAHFLRGKGCDEALITERLSEEDWQHLAEQHWEKKYGHDASTVDVKEKARRVRYMQSRGFDMNDITALL